MFDAAFLILMPHALLYTLIKLLIVVIANLPCILSHWYSYCHAEYSTYDLVFLAIKTIKPWFY